MTSSLSCLRQRSKPVNTYVVVFFWLVVKEKTHILPFSHWKSVNWKYHCPGHKSKVGNNTNILLRHKQLGNNAYYPGTIFLFKVSGLRYCVCCLIGNISLMLLIIPLTLLLRTHISHLLCKRPVLIISRFKRLHVNTEIYWPDAIHE